MDADCKCLSCRLVNEMIRALSEQPDDRPAYDDVVAAGARIMATAIVTLPEQDRPLAIVGAGSVLGQAIKSLKAELEQTIQ